MQYVLSLSDDAKNHLAVFTLREVDVKRAAVDFFFEIVGCDAEQLAEDGLVQPGQLDDVSALQQQIFGEDDQGQFIKDSVSITTNGRELNPDAPIKNAFVESARDGVKFMRCDAVVKSSSAEPVTSLPKNSEYVTADQELDKRINDFARIWFIWEIATGCQIDVTKDDPDLADSIAEAEKNGWIDIDVKKASYKLTADGMNLYQRYKDEAQELIRRYDIYGDVDVDAQGTIRFDTNLGRDFRIPIYELEGLDPFRSRFLLGLNDGEWSNMPDWATLYKSEKGYEMIMRDVCYAPTLSSLDREQLVRILDEGKAQLRTDGRFN